MSPHTHWFIHHSVTSQALRRLLKGDDMSTTSQKLCEADLDRAIASTQECRIEPIDEYPDLTDWRTRLVGAVCLVGVIGYCVLTTGE